MPALLETTIVKPVVVYVGLTSPPLKDSITQQGHVVDMTGATVSFSMRPLLSRTPVLSTAGSPIAPADADGNNVEYQWQPSDVANEGQYMAWWRFTLSGVTSETPEFPLNITDHGPGDEGVRTGAIADVVGDYMPITYARLRESGDFGDRRVQRLATLLQIKILGSAVDPDQEIHYDPNLLEYLGKRLALELIKPGRDYWARQHRTVTAQSPTEISSYPDMLAALDRLHEQLCEELAEDWRQLRYLVPGLVQRRVEALPISSLDDPSRPWLAIPATKSPYLMPPLETGIWAGLGDNLGIYPFFA